MRKEVKIGSVSWINTSPNPITFGAAAMAYEPDWVPKTYIGLAATANNDPGETIADFPAFRSGRGFRALLYCHVTLDIDDRTKKISDFRVLDAIHDPGYTPPFSMARFPSTVFSFDRNVYSSAWYAGEASPLSLVNTQRRHTNTTITDVPAGETVLINGIIKFRAGPHTDGVGVNSVMCPYHVPWVWCEMLLTSAPGGLKLYGRGSIFPSHSWYLDGKRVAKTAQVGDVSLPRRTLVPGWVPRIGNQPLMNIPNPLAIDVQRMAIFPVLSVGASAGGPQTPLNADSALTTPAFSHPNAVRAADVVTF